VKWLKVLLVVRFFPKVPLFRHRVSFSVPNAAYPSFGILLEAIQQLILALA